MIRTLAALFVLCLATAGAATTARVAPSISSSIGNGQTLAGKVRWTAAVSEISAGEVKRVEFIVDGAVKWTEKQAPYGFGGDQGSLDTTALGNGNHTFGVTATLENGSTLSVSATATVSNPRSAPPRNTTLPTISGERVEGKTLSAATGTWSGSEPMAFGYRWLRCDANGRDCRRIPRGRRQTFSPDRGEVGHRLRVSVVASNAAGSEATSDATAIVAAAGSPPANTARPVIAGTAQEGQTLTAAVGSWSGSQPLAFAYRWQRCDGSGGNCRSLSGGGRQAYTARSGDVGHRLQVLVVAANKFGSARAYSAQIGPVAARGTAPVNVSRPIVLGAPQAGASLTANVGSWTSATTIAFHYQWQRCNSSGAGCAPISGATSNRYTPGAGDVGSTLAVAVTAANAAGSSTMGSAVTQVVAAALPAGAVRLADGTYSIPVSSVSPPERLIVDKVSFSPNPLRSRTAVVARYRVVDTRGFAVRDALVYVVGLPYGRIFSVPEQPTGTDGYATLTLNPTAKLPLARGAALVLFVRARKPGDSLLAGVSTRRLVQLRLDRPG